LLSDGIFFLSHENFFLSDGIFFLSQMKNFLRNLVAEPFF
jgi:hypothetical protein